MRSHSADDCISHTNLENDRGLRGISSGSIDHTESLALCEDFLPFPFRLNGIPHLVHSPTACTSTPSKISKF